MLKFNRLMQSAFAAAAVLFVGASFARADTHTIDSSRYAAMAFSPKTGKYGYGYDCGSRAAAEKKALSHCPEPDAKIVSWVKFGWIVLAIGEDNSYGVGWEYGDGAGTKEARERAIEQLKKRGGKLKTLVQVCSGDVEPVVQTIK